MLSLNAENLWNRTFMSIPSAKAPPQQFDCGIELETGLSQPFFCRQGLVDMVAILPCVEARISQLAQGMTSSPVFLHPGFGERPEASAAIQGRSTAKNDA